MVGMSGATDKRDLLVTATALTLPSLAGAKAVEATAKWNATRPEICSSMAWGEPFMGTAVASMPVRARNNSATKCEGAPWPEVA